MLGITAPIAFPVDLSPGVGALDVADAAFSENPATDTSLARPWPVASRSHAALQLAMPGPRAIAWGRKSDRLCEVVLQVIEYVLDVVKYIATFHVICIGVLEKIKVQGIAAIVMGKSIGCIPSDHRRSTPSADSSERKVTVDAMLQSMRILKQ
jgi:hypothetical protein